MKDAVSPFADAALAPETVAFNAELAATLDGLPTPMEVPLDLIRMARAEGRGIFPKSGPLEGSRWQDLPGGGRVRLSPAAGAAIGTYLHIHGGGWTIGAPDQADLPNQRIAAETGGDVVSVQYRLAPEHPWPAAADDCEAAALWLLENRSGPVVIGGDSAGAHLSVVVLQRLKARGLAERILGAVLNYGMFDLRMTPSMQRWGDRYLILSTPVVAWFAGNLLGGHDPADPAVSPLLADLSGMPPALFQIGTMDPLLDDSLFMAARWQAAGVAADLAIYPGGVHAFDAFDIPIARQAQARQSAFIAACFS
ncbi:MAG: alpha/beta hydrolase [Pseudomonadota bacterium]